MIQRGSLSVNCILYALLIAIVLVFEFNPPVTSNSCGNRIVYPVDDTVRKTISMLYSSVIAAISLVICIGFLVFGLRLYHQLQVTGKVLRKTINTKVFDNVLLFTMRRCSRLH